jgi:hypothetical protein
MSETFANPFLVASSVNIDELQSKAKNVNATTIIGFNEPELPDQSNMTVDLAAQEWVRCIEPLRKAGIRCGSPGISSAPHAVGWLRDFIQRIREHGSDIDFYCFHWLVKSMGNRVTRTTWLLRGVLH